MLVLSVKINTFSHTWWREDAVNALNHIKPNGTGKKEKKNPSITGKWIAIGLSLGRIKSGNVRWRIANAMQSQFGHTAGNGKPIE